MALGIASYGLGCVYRYGDFTGSRWEANLAGAVLEKCLRLHHAHCTPAVPWSNLVRSFRY